MFCDTRYRTGRSVKLKKDILENGMQFFFALFFEELPGDSPTTIYSASQHEFNTIRARFKKQRF